MISVTERAAEQIAAAQASRGLVGFGLKLFVVGGGCEGFLYDLAFAEAPDARDQVFESNGVRVFVDPRTLAVVEGLQIDHAETTYGAGFVFANPRAARKCGCGASFGL